MGHYHRYLKGDGIDVGCGDDVLRLPEGTAGTVRPWDVRRGDGDGALLAGVADGSLDFVYSSHCLEHLDSVPAAINNWLRVLRPGGHLYVVVPDYLLYEKLTWPSIHNGEHRHSFSLAVARKDVGGRANHWQVFWDVYPLLDDCAIVAWGTQDAGFDYNRGVEDQTLTGAMAQLYFVARKGE